MSYMILGYGSYDAPDDVTDIETEEEAMNILHTRITEWCAEHEINVEDTDYCDGDDIFYYGEEEKGACIIALYRVPLLTNEADQCLWDAKVEMEKAYFASEDYKWTLTDNGVDGHALNAQSLIDRAMELMGGWEYEED